MTRRLTISLVVTAAAMTVAVATAGLGADNKRLDSPRKRWQATDQCHREAFRKFPDYTQEGATKREAYTRACLEEHRLPSQSNSSGEPEPTEQ